MASRRVLIPRLKRNKAIHDNKADPLTLQGSRQRRFSFNTKERNIGILRGKNDLHINEHACWMVFHLLINAKTTDGFNMVNYQFTTMTFFIQHSAPLINVFSSKIPNQHPQWQQQLAWVQFLKPALRVAPLVNWCISFKHQSSYVSNIISINIQAIWMTVILQTMLSN